MKKLYKKSTVHPSPPLISDHLALLPAAIPTLTVVLSPQDKEVLAYLISSSTHFPTSKKTTFKSTSAAATTADHPPLFHCSCFRCYMSYWVRWDSSPNRQLIHEIIDAFEEGLANKKEKGKKDRKKKAFIEASASELEGELTQSTEVSPVKMGESESAAEGGGGGGGGGEEEGSVRKLVSFLWSVWT